MGNAHQQFWRRVDESLQGAGYAFLALSGVAAVGVVLYALWASLPG